MMKQGGCVLYGWNLIPRLHPQTLAPDDITRTRRQAFGYFGLILVEWEEVEVTLLTTFPPLSPSLLQRDNCDTNRDSNSSLLLTPPLLNCRLIKVIRQANYGSAAGSEQPPQTKRETVPRKDKK